MANSTIKFPQEMPPAANINGDDKIMIADAATNEAKSATWDAAKQYLNITGIELKPISPGPLPAGPAGEVRKMQITEAGTWTFAGSATSPFVNPDGSVMILWWDGSAWSIADQYMLLKGRDGINGDLLASEWTGSAYDSGLVYPMVRAYRGELYRVADGEVTTAGDEPTLSSKWTLVGGEVITGVSDYIYTETVQPIPYNREANTLYYGFGQPFGVHRNIGGVRFNYRVSQTLPVPNKLRFMIFDTNRTGAILVDKTIDVNPVAGIQYNAAEFTFDEVFTNDEGVVLWIEVRANGAIGWRGSDPEQIYTQELGYERRRVNITATTDLNVQPPSFGNNEAQIDLLIYEKEVGFNEKGQKAFNKAISTIISDDSNFPKEMYASVSDTDLRIMSKYNESYDLLIVFKYAMFNNLYTFQSVGLIANSSNNIDISKINEPVSILINTTSSDNIGPVNITGFGFIGANHSYNNDNITKTAINNSYKIYNGNNEIGSGFAGYVNDLVVIVDVSILNPAFFPEQQELINERVMYYITSGNIEVTVSHKYAYQATLALYYGAQITPQNVLTKIWFNNSFDDIQDYTSTGVNSGNGNFLPNKVVLSNDTKEVCMALQLNRNIGLGANPSQISNIRPVLFTADTTRKVYFQQCVSKGVAVGDSYFWNACYSFFDGRLVDNTNTPYVNNLTMERELMISVDSKQSGDFIINNANYIGRKKTIFHEVNASIDEYTEPTGLKVYFSSKGSIIV